MGSAKLKTKIMAYAILRTRKIKTAGQMAGMQRHNDRTNDVSNADKDLTRYNETLSKTQTNNLRNDIEARIEETGVKTRSNSVMAIEHLMTFSPEFLQFRKVDDNGVKKLMGNVEQWKLFKHHSIKWLKERYGAENLVHVSIHYDEKTPHIHAYVVPIIEKKVKWKNKSGQGEKNTYSLAARDFLGGKEKMQEMQDSFHSAVAHLGLERGQRNSTAKHEHVQKYYSRVNQSMEIEQEMNDFKPAASKITIPDPPIFGKDKWRSEIENTINTEVEAIKIEAIKGFKGAFEGEFEKIQESRKLTRQNKRVLSVLSNDLKIANESITKERLIAQRAKEELNKAIEFLDKFKKATFAAVANQNPEAIQAIMNLRDQEQKKSQDKRKGMGM